MFFLFSDEVADLDWKKTLRQLTVFGFISLSGKSMPSQALCQFTYWFSQLPSYIKVLMPPLRCESRITYKA
jgi:hypothetical protein